jgi:tetratricopeptide (TPR) repeat protein
VVRDNNPMAASLKIVPTLVLPTALALMPLWAGMAQTPAAGGSQLLERVYKAQDYYALSELAREQITLNPKNVYAHYYMAIALQQLGQIREADREYRKVIDLDKNGPYAMRAIQSLRTLATSATRAHQTAPAVTAATNTTNSGNKAKDANTTTSNQSGPSSQRECLINAAEREKTSATARFNGEVNSINKQESLNAADKDARIQEALKRMMRTQSEVDAKLSGQLTELNG